MGYRPVLYYRQINVTLRLWKSGAWHSILSMYIIFIYPIFEGDFSKRDRSALIIDIEKYLTDDHIHYPLALSQTACLKFGHFQI